MSTYGLVRPAVTDWRQEARQAMKDALQSRAVVVTFVICGTVVSLALVGALAWLAWAQRDATMVLSLVSLALNALVYGRLRKVEQQTNGHTTRLMDAALKDKE